MSEFARDITLRLETVQRGENTWLVQLVFKVNGFTVAVSPLCGGNSKETVESLFAHLKEEVIRDPFPLVKKWLPSHTTELLGNWLEVAKKEMGIEEGE